MWRTTVTRQCTAKQQINQSKQTKQSIKRNSTIEVRSYNCGYFSVVTRTQQQCNTFSTRFPEVVSLKESSSSDQITHNTN